VTQLEPATTPGTNFFLFDPKTPTLVFEWTELLRDPIDLFPGDILKVGVIVAQPTAVWLQYTGYSPAEGFVS
jgi:hypothetical protein